MQKSEIHRKQNWILVYKMCFISKALAEVAAEL